MQIKERKKSTNLIQTAAEIANRSFGTEQSKIHPPKLNLSTATNICTNEMVKYILTPFYYYKFHFFLRYSYFRVLKNILEALLIPWNAVLTLLAGFRAVLFFFILSHSLAQSQFILTLKKHKNAPGKILSLFRTRMDTRKRNPLESPLSSFQNI